MVTVGIGAYDTAISLEGVMKEALAMAEIALGTADFAGAGNGGGQLPKGTDGKRGSKTVIHLQMLERADAILLKIQSMII